MLEENTVVQVEKVNQELGVATCVHEDKCGLFPLKALKIGSKVMKGLQSNALMSSKRENRLLAKYAKGKPAK